MLLVTSESTGVHWSVWECVVVHTNCVAAFGISSSIAVSAVITLFNFNRLGYTTTFSDLPGVPNENSY